jgi:hypothetical protein
MFIVREIIKLFYFSFIQEEYTLKEFAYFQPLSIINFYNINTLEGWLTFPLSKLGFFEILFPITISYFLKEKDDSILKYLKITFVAYWGIMSLWLIIYSYLGVYFS